MLSTGRRAVLISNLDRSLVVLALLSITTIAVFPVKNSDIFWHLAMGREMLTSGQIVNTEIFSYTFFGKPFHNHEWLAQTLFYRLYQAAGLDALIWLKYLLVSAMGAFSYLAARTAGASRPLALLAVLAICVLGLERLLVRPHLFSFTLVALIGWLISRRLAHQKSLRGYLLIPLILLIWDCLHGAIYGWVILSMLLAGELAWKRWPPAAQGEDASAPQVPLLAKIILVALALSLVSPFGLLNYSIFTSLVSEHWFKTTISEFLPAYPSKYPAFWVYAALYWALFFLIKFDDKRRYLLAMHLLFFALAIRYSRLVPIFVILSAPLLASLLTRLWADSRLGRSLPRWTTSVALALFAPIIFTIKSQAPIQPYNYGLGFHHELYPVGVTRYLQSNPLPGQIYNSDRFGGYLALHLFPAKRIFHYNHHMVFDNPQALIDNPELLKKYPINLAIIGSADERERLFPASEWADLYRGPTAILAIKRTPQNQALIAEREMGYFYPFITLSESLNIGRDPRARQRLLRELVTYLQYREDQQIAALLKTLIGPSAWNLARPSRRQIITAVATYNRRHFLDADD